MFAFWSGLKSIEASTCTQTDRSETVALLSPSVRHWNQLFVSLWWVCSCKFRSNDWRHQWRRVALPADWWVAELFSRSPCSRLCPRWQGSRLISKFRWSLLLGCKRTFSWLALRVAQYLFGWRSNWTWCRYFDRLANVTTFSCAADWS